MPSLSTLTTVSPIPQFSSADWKPSSIVDNSFPVTYSSLISNTSIFA
jgi:hypothetical protein